GRRRRRNRRPLALLLEERERHAALELAELHRVLGVVVADDEADHAPVEVAPIDRDGSDLHTNDQRVREVTLADDAEELHERRASVADALEPPIGADVVEVYLSLQHASMLVSSQRAVKSATKGPARDTS